MKKFITVMLAALLCVAMLCGCGEEKKIEELQTKIAELESENASLESAMYSSKATLESAQEVYNQPHSSSYAVQAELEEMKSNMSQLSRQIAKYEADIALNNALIKGYQEQIDRLQDDN